jgi:hypothetical protein
MTAAKSSPQPDPLQSKGVRSPLPGAKLLGIWPACAAGAILFNISYLRRYHPGAISGKLSDLGINFLLPVILLASAEWVVAIAQAIRRRPFHSIAVAGVTLACMISGSYFTLLKTLPAFTPVHFAILRILALPFQVSTAFRNTVDPTDLLTLVSTLVAWFYLKDGD